MIDKDVLIKLLADALKQCRVAMGHLDDVFFAADNESDLALEAYEKYEEEQKEREN